MSRIFISAAHKSSGKTSISIGLCAALKQRGRIVQAFKKGPDYIDPYWLSLATSRDCFNLDFYTMEKDEMLSLLQARSYDADISLIEGNNGLYDGLDLDGSNSNAALAKLTQTPVILVLSARGMTRGIAPLILGYQAFDKEVAIKGVILNRLGGSRHEEKLRRVIEHYTDVQVVGAIHNDKRLTIDERHLGLVPGHEDPFCAEKIQLLSQAIEQQVDLEDIINIADQSPTLATSTPISFPKPEIPEPTENITLGLVRNAAFGFYYPDDIQAFQQAGVKIIEIDPFVDTQLPDIDALFIGGGFPETSMEKLEKNTSLRQAIKAAINNGLPAYAECGGLMYLARSIEWNKRTHKMVGCLEGDVIMEARPQGRGYVQLEETSNHPWPQHSEKIIYAHEFHYSHFKNVDKNAKFAFRVLRGTGINGEYDGIIHHNLIACYTHQRTSRNNPWTQRFIEFTRQHQQNTLKA